ncbi:MAG: hypothetical protein HWD59_02180 [Coxiellaceae bacterium]|nr:MAG: hypothetical protein HWD59_02180 [Coxiellaceae bacterium]
MKFQAWVTVPSENIANQIVALMPNAQITTCNNNGCTVIAEAPAPGIGYVPLNQNYQIMDIGNVTIKVTDNDDTTKGIGIPFFSCPTGWIPKVSTMIQSIEPKK